MRTKKALPPDEDYLFEPAGATVPVYVCSHLFDEDLSFVEVRNDSIDSVVIQRHARIGTVSDVDFATAYHTSSAPGSEDREANWSDMEDFEHIENTEDHVEIENLSQSLPGRRYRHMAAKALKKAAKAALGPRLPAR